MVRLRAESRQDLELKPHKKICQTCERSLTMGKIYQRLTALLNVKSIVTIALTAVFAYLAIIGETSQEFVTIYTTIVAFYFGTQSQRIAEAMGEREIK